MRHHRVRPACAATRACALLLGLATLPVAGVLRADAPGASVFASECSVCHSVDQGKTKVGPSLFGVLGRPAGSLAGYNYSDAMKTSGLTWTEESLQRYLENPAATVHGVRMPYPGLKDATKRSALIAWLATVR